MDGWLNLIPVVGQFLAETLNIINEPRYEKTGYLHMHVIGICENKDANQRS